MNLKITIQLLLFVIVTVVYSAALPVDCISHIPQIAGCNVPKEILEALESPQPNEIFKRVDTSDTTEAAALEFPQPNVIFKRAMSNQLGRNV
ncbi:MAG: hypothetical protein NXY57DRAFT_1026218 [Lentinula lateritia]|nr:MAG: hypothetical protein NXY57DRAFT_1026218 [Lentinula lateritia]